MIVWGGLGTGFVYLNTGGRYNPSTDSWVATSTGANVPDARSGHTAVWTSSEMIVWGGDDGSYVNTGGRYNPTADSWTATSTTNAPDPREVHTAVWTGSELIIWGGIGNSGFENTGGRYNPGTNSWTTIFSPLAGRAGPTSVWTGSQMIVWGGDFRDNFGGDHYVNTGGRYNPSTNSWTLTSTTGAPDARTVHTAVWTGNQMIVWGGADNTNRFNTGGRYCAASGPTPPPAPIANPATYVASNSFTANWSSVSGATGYRLDVSTSSSFSTYVTGYQNLNVGNAISRSVTGLNASTAYYYRVRAYNGVGTSGNSNIVNVTTLSATGPPVVITNPATLVASFSATLNGSVDPHGLATNVYFQYGTTTSYGLTTALQSKTGNTYQNVVANISGLTASTTYHFRMVATNGAGTRYGADRTFTTLTATGPPVVITNPATLIASFSATLNGSVDPHGLTTNVYFQYGTTTSYGSTTASQSKTGNTYQNVAAKISGLAASTTYHFRIVATNSAGTKYGSDRTFTTLSATGPPVVITNSATNVASSSATLNGSVDPHGLTTNVYFQYGTTTSYGHTTATQSKTGNTYQNVAANISSLSASTTYHFRMVATNSAGTVYGSDKTFTTL
jgi:N-acetylneuraminic acid mutarotase